MRLSGLVVSRSEEAFSGGLLEDDRGLRARRDALYRESIVPAILERVRVAFAGGSFDGVEDIDP